jgi:hypothetical protein
MRKQILIIGSIAAAVTISVIACTSGDAKDKNANAEPTKEERIARGEYLVSVIGCDDCHSPKIVTPTGFEIIPELRLSGYPSTKKIPEVDTTEVGKGWMLLAPDLTAAVGPWGMSFAGNLTSDPTGIGNWPEENFIRALRHGKLKGMENGRNLLPPMPWFVYKNMTDEDLKSIYAFLQTTKPVHNVVPAPRPLSSFK